MKYSPHMPTFSFHKKRIRHAREPRIPCRVAPAGFTLIETLAAVTLLVVALVSPMLLTERSLTSAYYARDQITASYLAQEAIEAVRQIRDGNILEIAQNSSSPAVDLFSGIPVASDCTSASSIYFTVDATQQNASAVIGPTCGSTAASCPYLQTNGILYGYGSTGWTNTDFKRSVAACYTDASKDEVRLTVTVLWQTSSLQSRSFTMSEDLYRWVQDGSGA